MHRAEFRARGGTRLLGALAPQQGTVELHVRWAHQGLKSCFPCARQTGQNHLRLCPPVRAWPRAVTHLSVRVPLAAGPVIPPGEARCAAAPWAFGSADLVTQAGLPQSLQPHRQKCPLPPRSGTYRSAPSDVPPRLGFTGSTVKKENPSYFLYS